MIELFRLLFNFKLADLFYKDTNNTYVQLFRYCFVGGIAFLIDFGLYCLLCWLGIHYLLSGVLAFVVSFMFNFGVSRWLIFAAKAEKQIKTREIISVFAISVIGLGLTELLLYMGTDLLLLDFRLSKIVASVLILFWNYAARKILVYR